MKKLLLVAGGIAALCFVLALGLFAACVVRAGHRFSIGSGEKSTREESHALELRSGGLLTVEIESGDVRVRATEGESASIEAKITAWGETLDDAQQSAQRAHLAISASADGVRVTLADARLEKTKTWGTVTYGVQADLAIRVPAGVRLEIASGSGDLRAEGPFAASKLRSSYGDVHVRDVSGDLEATSESGNVDVAKVEGTGELRAKSGYGDVHLSQCKAGRVDARSGSGDVKLEEVEGQNVAAESGYGDIDFVRVAGELEGKTASGNVRAREIGGPRAAFSTSYGDVRVEKASGELEAKSSSGDVRVTEFEGALEARSSYGSIEVEGVFTDLVADTGSGDVVASALPGSKIAKTWKLSSSYGDVKLSVVESFACDLDAKTEYGEIDLGLPIQVAAGGLDSAKESVRGKLNGGGGSVQIRCGSGDVAISTLGK